ncbi:TPA: hypothetical protein GM645_00070 [Klebsiella pneumoniae]|uniref:hypothetical protein n=1 Tax=Klebsiella pneumoniae TaxID=573 RepID=UPI0009BBF212|nr:hypothetical protein [Klebsiella pneumoniae]HBR6059185.1 hypothetical protein [Klebsiella pneumoniae]HBS6726860.1 hypothetical protein [Klebsiella pneumoniae]HBX0707463.1 hypothetical protein [Klebsiella pneumoniae]HCB0969502.1 hypothetical protein [Klebsiella pneumoniae]HCB1251204.1 hypothetical protein [Klebsiella pneumoniae]
MSFPIITKGNYHTEQGNIYIKRDDGVWRQNVNYLAAVPTQYGCTTYEQQFDKIIEWIESGKLRGNFAYKERYNMIGDKLYHCRKRIDSNPYSYQLEGE